MRQSQDEPWRSGDPRRTSRWTSRGFDSLRGAGEIDKKRDPELTHLTDGIGYYVARRFPVRPDHAETVPLRI